MVYSTWWRTVQGVQTPPSWLRNKTEQIKRPPVYWRSFYLVVYSKSISPTRHWCTPRLDTLRLVEMSGVRHIVVNVVEVQLHCYSICFMVTLVDLHYPSICWVDSSLQNRAVLKLVSKSWFTACDFYHYRDIPEVRTYNFFCAGAWWHNLLRHHHHLFTNDLSVSHLWDWYCIRSRGRNDG